MKRERKGLAGKGQCFSEEGLTGATACSLLALRALTTHPPRPRRWGPNCPRGSHSPPWGERAVRYRGDMNTPVASLDHLSKLIAAIHKRIVL